MNNDPKFTIADYSLRIILGLLAVAIVILLITSLVSGIIAFLLLALAIVLILVSIFGFDRIRQWIR